MGAIPEWRMLVRRSTEREPCGLTEAGDNRSERRKSSREWFVFRSLFTSKAFELLVLSLPLKK
jgi:hypothetical protein